jgi:hypothetical protein
VKGRSWRLELIARMAKHLLNQLQNQLMSQNNQQTPNHWIFQKLRHQRGHKLHGMMSHQSHELFRTMQVAFVSAGEICIALSASVCAIRLPSITRSRIAFVGTPFATLNPPFDSTTLPR